LPGAFRYLGSVHETDNRVRLASACVIPLGLAEDDRKGA
jgi:hypothetical protein